MDKNDFINFINQPVLKTPAYISLFTLALIAGSYRAFKLCGSFGFSYRFLKIVIMLGSYKMA